MCWLLLGVCAALAIYMAYKLSKDKDDEGQGGGAPGHGVPQPAMPYRLRTRPLVPALDTSIYVRY